MNDKDGDFLKMSREQRATKFKEDNVDINAEADRFDALLKSVITLTETRNMTTGKHLIFAAADLFAACEAAWFPLNVMYRHKPGTNGFAAIEKIYAALSKAEGRTGYVDRPATYISPTALDALQAIANLPTGKNEDEMNGQENAYRAVEALFLSPPRIESKT